MPECGDPEGTDGPTEAPDLLRGSVVAHAAPLPVEAHEVPVLH
jgi:hypothetical protein